MALGTSLTQPLAELRAAFEAAAAALPPPVRTLAGGERGETGARFVRVGGDLTGEPALPR